MTVVRMKAAMLFKQTGPVIHLRFWFIYNVKPEFLTEEPHVHITGTPQCVLFNQIGFLSD